MWLFRRCLECVALANRFDHAAECHLWFSCLGSKKGSASEITLLLFQKMERGIEFVKHFRAHMGNIQNIAVNSTGSLLATISNDKSMKIFDVVNFDMINMMKLTFTPQTCEWIHSAGEPLATIAVSDRDSPSIMVYDGRGSSVPLKTLDSLHHKPVVIMRFNPVFNTVISIDKVGIVEYWHGEVGDYKFPKETVEFEFNSDTDLFAFATAKCIPTGMDVSQDGRFVATMASDRKVRIFRYCDDVG